MKKNIFILIFHIAFFVSSVAQTQVKVNLLESSLLTVHGSTNLLNFQLKQPGNKILNKSIILVAEKHGNKLYLSQNKLAIVVKNFKSENFIAQSEFYKLMQTDEHPHLHIKLNYFEFNTESENQYSTGNASLNINITGVSKNYDFPVSATVNDNHIKVTGRKKMNIRDFGLIAPTAMLGMVKVSEWIEIEFNIVCKVDFIKSKLTT